jgi:hypothetical protein
LSSTGSEGAVAYRTTGLRSTARRRTPSRFPERVARLAQDWERINEDDGEDVSVGVVAVVYECKWADGTTAVTFSCSDPRPEVQADLFRRAKFQAELGGQRDLN